MKGLIVVVFFLIHLAIIASAFVSLVGLCKQCNDSKYVYLITLHAFPSPQMQDKHFVLFHKKGADPK